MAPYMYPDSSQKYSAIVNISYVLFPGESAHIYADLARNI